MIQFIQQISLTFKAVFWSFFGVRKRQDYDADARSLNPIHIIIVGVICAISFVMTLLLIIRQVLS
jgi:hypothetical protein